MRLVIVATHPIQHFCPQYASLAAVPGVELTVVFASMKGIEAYHDEGFGTEVEWGHDLLQGYDNVSVGSGRLFSVLTELRPDWLMIYGYSSRISQKAWAWSLRSSTTRIAYVADSELRHGMPSSLKSRLKRAFLTRLFRRVDAFLTVGDANEDYYRWHGVETARFVRMHFPIDPHMVFRPEAAAEKRKQYGIADDALVVLNVGKFEARKRQGDLVAATANIPKVHLVLAGSGAEYDACREQAHGRSDVTFLGFVPPRELADYYALADVYVHPSTYDPHPLAVSEAAAAGCALVVSDRIGSWGPNDDVIPHVSGVVFPGEDVDALAEVLKELARDRERARQLGVKAQQNSRAYQALAHGGFLAALPQLAQ